MTIINPQNRSTGINFTKRVEKLSCMTFLKVPGFALSSSYISLTRVGNCLPFPTVKKSTTQKTMKETRHPLLLISLPINLPIAFKMNIINCIINPVLTF
jgi:hypothetical protein